MLDVLKSEIKAFVVQSRSIHEKERHQLQNSRNLRGSFSKKHKLEGKPPVPTEKQVKASELENAADLAQQDLDKFFGLHRFRVHILRKQARDTHLAYGFLKGIPFSRMETIRYSNPDFNNIERIITNINEGENGGDIRDLKQRYAEWVAEAKNKLPINWNLPQ